LHRLGLIPLRIATILEDLFMAFSLLEILRSKRRAAPSRGADDAPPRASEAAEIDALIAATDAAARRGDRQHALESYARLSAAYPSFAKAHFKYGNLLKDTGQLEHALASYDRAVALDPGYAYAYCNRAVVLQRLDRLDEALASCDRAIDLDPNDAFSHYNRAELLRKLERPEEALASIDAAIAIHPDYAEAHCNRGTLLKDSMRWDEALRSYDRSIRSAPAFPVAYFNRGVLLQKLGDARGAMSSYDMAIELDPSYADAHCNRGRLLVQLKQESAGLASLDRAISLAPGSVEAHFNRAEALARTRQTAAAMASYDAAVALDRLHPFLLGSRRHAKMSLCDWTDFSTDCEQLATAIQNGVPVAHPWQIFALLDEPPLHRRAAELYTRREHPANLTLPALAKRPGGAKIHIGYFSGDFREHAVSILMAELFECHDRSRFHTTAFSFGPDTQDAMRERLEKSFDEFIDVSAMTDTDIASLVRRSNVDIAVDLAGHTSESRPGVFALRAAPIQVNYLGYAGTLGTDYMDYLIADTTVIPESQREHYAEKIIALPYSYLPNDTSRRISDRVYARAEFALPEESFVFCCFNNSYKITPPTFDGWMRILRRVERSVLWLAQIDRVASDNLKREAVRRGVAADRLIFADRMPSLPDHLARLRLADLSLDTLPYNAHATAIDALWSGLPIVTRIGSAFAGRVAASLLHSIGLPELVANTDEEYETLAVRLAENPQQLTAIRGKLAANRLTTPLFDTRLLTRHLESAYTEIHARHLSDLPPEHLLVRTETRR